MPTQLEKLVIDYTGLNIIDVQEMDLDIYLFFRREAYIYYHSRTEQGREFLRDAWRLEQTKPDRKALRDKYGRKEG